MWLFCALSGLSADSRSFVEGFMDPRCMLGYSHVQATARAFICSRDDACLSIYLNHAVAERVAYRYKLPGRWLCARTGDKQGGSQRRRKPPLHASGMLMRTEHPVFDFIEYICRMNQTLMHTTVLAISACMHAHAFLQLKQHRGTAVRDNACARRRSTNAHR